MVKKLVCLLYLAKICLTGFSQNRPDTNFHLYLLAGQSNMAGRGVIEGKYKEEGSPQIFMLDKNNEWVPARHPLHFDKPAVVGVGPGLAFALEMLRSNPGVKIGLVPCAVGGSSIDAWKRGAYDSATKTHPFDDAVLRISAAMRAGMFRGAIWHQGESDSDPKNAEQYMEKLMLLMFAFRVATYQPDLPIVVGELGRYKKVYENINKVIKTLPTLLPFTAVASSKGLKEKGDMTHFDSASAEKLGKRYAKQMKRLQRKLHKEWKRMGPVPAF